LYQVCCLVIILLKNNNVRVDVYNLQILECITMIPYLFDPCFVPVTLNSLVELRLSRRHQKPFDITDNNMV